MEILEKIDFGSRRLDAIETSIFRLVEKQHGMEETQQVQNLKRLEKWIQEKLEKQNIRLKNLEGEDYPISSERTLFQIGTLQRKVEDLEEKAHYPDKMREGEAAEKISTLQRKVEALEVFSFKILSGHPEPLASSEPSKEPTPTPYSPWNWATKSTIGNSPLYEEFYKVLVEQEICENDLHPEALAMHLVKCVKLYDESLDESAYAKRFK